MFSIEGYEPLNSFRKAAFDTIYAFVATLRWKREEEEKAAGEVQTRYPWARYNSELAAEWVVYDLFTKMRAEGKQKPKILRSDGVVIDIPVDILRPVHYGPHRESPFAIAREKAFAETGIKESDESVFGLKSLSMRYWIEPLLTEEGLFGFRELKATMSPQRIEKFLSVINWQTGVIDLSQVRAYLEIVELSRQYADAARRAAFVAPVMIGRASSHELEYIPHKYLLPFDGCSIIAPADWLAKLDIEQWLPKLDGEVGRGGPEAEDLREDCSPTEKIVKLWEEGMKRDEIHPIIASTFGVSLTKAKILWSTAREKHPKISKSGPRKVNS